MVPSVDDGGVHLRVSKVDSEGTAAGMKQTFSAERRNGANLRTPSNPPA